MTAGQGQMIAPCRPPRQSKKTIRQIGGSKDGARLRQDSVKQAAWIFEGVPLKPQLEPNPEQSHGVAAQNKPSSETRICAERDTSNSQTTCAFIRAGAARCACRCSPLSHVHRLSAEMPGCESGKGPSASGCVGAGARGE